MTTGLGLVALAILGWLTLNGLFAFTLAALSRRDSGSAHPLTAAFLVESRHENANVFISPYGVVPVTALRRVTDAEIHSLYGRMDRELCFERARHRRADAPADPLRGAGCASELS
jgi:hypothetical protein